MIRHPACEPAVALALYWRQGPGFFTQYATRDEAQGDPIWDFLREVEARFSQGTFARSTLAFDPRHDPVPMGTLDLPGMDWTALYESQIPPRHLIPEQMKNAVLGRAIDALNGFPDWIDGVPPAVWKELDRRYEEQSGT